MMTYAFTKSPVSLDRLDIEIRSSAIVTALDHLQLDGADALSVVFKAELSSGDQEILNGLIAAHTGEAININPPETVTLDMPTDDEDALLVRPKTTKPGWMQQFRCFSFKTAAWNSLFSKTPDGVQHTDCNIKFFDESNAEITAEENIGNAVKTQVEFEPPNDFDIAGGMVFALEQATQDIYAWVVAVPDVPEFMGGSKVNLDGGMNMKCLIPGVPFQIDGRTPKRMFYSPIYHTNKIRIILKHPAGCQFPIQFIFDKYKA